MYARKFTQRIVQQIRLDRSIYTNFLSLSLVQVTNFLLPILTYPYLFRTVGASHFGAITYALNLMIYLGTIIDYGFNLSAPRAVALAKDNIDKLSFSVSSIVITKLVLLGCCVMLLLAGVVFIPKLHHDIWLYVYGLLYLAGGCLLPTWLFQGLEDMRHLTWINLIAKAGATVLIFMLVRTPDEYSYVLGLFGIANLISGLLGLYHARKAHNITIVCIDWGTLKREIKSGWYYFLSNFTAVIFSNSTILILGFFVANDTLGKYGIAEKIAFSVWQLVSVFSQATYPTLCRLSLTSHKAITSFMRKFHLPFTILIAFLCLSVAMGADWVVTLAVGSKQPDTVILLRILCLVPLAVSLNVSACQILLVYEKQKHNAVIFNSCTIVSLLMCTYLSREFGAIGAAWAAVITQIILTLSIHLTLIVLFPAFSLWKERS